MDRKGRATTGEWRRLHRLVDGLKLVVGTVAAIGFLLVSLTKSFVVGLFLASCLPKLQQSRLEPRLSPVAAGERDRETDGLQTANTSECFFVLPSY